MNHTEFSSKGGKASAKKLSKAERKKRASVAAKARWAKKPALAMVAARRGKGGK
jgi:hypothetical protein